MTRTNLLQFDAEGFADFFTSLGEKPFRARQVMRWIHRNGEGDFDAMSDVAKSLRAKLADIACVEAPVPVRDSTSTDGTRKWLIDVGAGNAVETVFIPEERRGTLCISTQAGCALDCAFCSTGKQGFNRNLEVSEIIGQLWLANRALGAVRGGENDGERVISNVVMMGMGEPLANFDATVAALKLMLDDNAYGLSRRRVTVSTSGIVPAMDRLRDACPVALAVSLHAPNDALRDELVPINKKYPLRELLAACVRYLDRAPRVLRVVVTMPSAIRISEKRRMRSFDERPKGACGKGLNGIRLYLHGTWRAISTSCRACSSLSFTPSSMTYSKVMKSRGARSR